MKYNIKIDNKISKISNNDHGKYTKEQLNILRNAKNEKGLSHQKYKYYMNMVYISKYRFLSRTIKIDSFFRRRKYNKIIEKLSKLSDKSPILKAQSKVNKTEKEIQLLKAAKKAKNNRILRISLKSTLYLFLIFYAIVTLYPFIWAIGGSFREQSEFSTAGLNPLPKHWTMDNFRYLFTNKNTHFNKWVWNSIFTSVGGVAANLVLNTLAGYALARFKFKGRNQMFWALISLSMVPGQVLMIPNFLIVKNMGLFNNLMALIIPSAVNIGYIFMTRQFFLNFPKDIEEAAAIDGMSRLKTLWKIIIPLMRPMIITQSIFLFMGFWNNFLSAKIYMLDSEKFTLTVGIQTLVSGSQYNIEYGQILAASTFSLLPVLAIYTTLNGLILKGQRSDGDK